MVDQKKLREELDEEVSSILSSSFGIKVVETKTVPHSGDPYITFPNLDTETQGAKLIETCVLYIDIRRSTNLNLEHQRHTVAKLYSAFIRAMTKTARSYDGHVRGIIGDRVMVIFDVDDCFANALHCAVAMNTVAKFVVNKHFKAGDVHFGIGIDFGRMLATKTGIRKQGYDQPNYMSLVWLGRPANVASKLTDIAGKPAEHQTEMTVEVAFKPQYSILGLITAGRKGTYRATSNDWQWYTQSPREFLDDLNAQYYPAPIRFAHRDPNVEAFYTSDKIVQTRQPTPSILMTAPVWNGFKKAVPTSTLVTLKLTKAVKVTVPGYTATVYGTDAEFPGLKA